MYFQHLLRFLIVVNFALVLVNISQATSLKLERNQPVKVDFVFQQWNKNPAVADSATLLFRDATSGKMANIYLEETGPNTGIFTGSFSISFVGDTDVSPEVYMPPPSLAKNGINLETLIKENKLVRKAYFLRKEGNSQLLSVFNTKQQAIEAFERFRTNIKGKPIIDSGALASQRIADKATEEAKIAKLAFAQEMMRKQLEEDEKRKQSEMKKQQESLAFEEREKRIKEAQELAISAMSLYKIEKYTEAESKFKRAMELDPNNVSYNFQYGVTLFKNEKINEALVALKLANGSNFNQHEKAYFMGLSYMKMKEFDSAKEQFQSIVKSKDETMGPMASFYVGIINFSQEKYPEAKINFQYVLDHSKDAKLDTQAENYMDQIANLEQFLEKKKHRFTFDITIGEQYDSNVLFLPDGTSTSATTTNKDGLRSMLIMGLEYRAIITEKHQLSFTTNYTDMYTVSTKLKPESSLQQADPIVLDYKLPYKYSSTFLGKGYQLTVTPGIETINLNADATGSRELIMSSTLLTSNQAFVWSDNYMMTLDINYQKDDNKQADPIGTDSDATKNDLAINNIWFRDQKKTEALLGNIGYSLYNATGSNEKYNKTSLSLGYLMPARTNASMTYMLDYSITSYPKHDSSRKDSATGLTAAYSKPLKEALALAVAGNYSLNSSNVDSYKYNKWSVTATLNWSKNF